MKLSIETFTDNLIGFRVRKMENVDLLWINSNELMFLNEKKLNANNFTESFAYAIPENQFFESIKFDDNKNKIMTAERYGGLGVGVNGGGARCGNDNNFQIKGVGRNPVAGKTSDHWHSYGGLNLVDAIYETINAAVLGNILPVGVATVFGIIITGKNTAILPGLHDSCMEERRSYGALLVREACVRPAHFFRSLHFKPEINDGFNFLKDVSRVRNVNKILAHQFGDAKIFVVQIGEYLARYANQFAFARAARISHGSISPSNMCLDGRWLDLTNTSFLEGGKNTGGKVPFYAEPDAIMEMLEEFIYTFSKYNSLNLTPKVLLNYYKEQLQSYFISHISYVIGVNYSDIDDGVANPALVVVGDFFSKIISSATQSTTTRAYEYKSDDPVICLIESVFISLANFQAATANVNACLGDQVGDCNELFSSFSNILVGIYKNLKIRNITYKNFLIATAIISLKRALVPEYFFMGRLEGYIYGIVKNSKEELFARIIEDSIGIANWAFDLKECLSASNEKIISQDYRIMILKTRDFSVWFEPYQGRYGSSVPLNKNISYFEKYDDVVLHIERENYCIIISEYCFHRYLEKIGSTVRVLEHI